MNHRLVLSLLLLLSTLSFASTCISCDELLNLPKARLLGSLDEANKTLQMTVYYENLSASPTRQPVSDSIILVEISNTSGLGPELYRTYTDAEGQANFDFSTWGAGCVNFKVLYCPFCTPESPTCGFSECMNYSGITTAYTNASDIPTAPGAVVPGTLSDKKYLPEVNQISYCPTPPLSLASAPAICLPLLIIFALLAGSLYLSGRNPFAAFNIGGARVGRHLRYQARGRGYMLDTKMVAQSVSGAVQEAGERAQAKAQGREYEGARYFMYSNIRDLKDVVVGTPQGAGVGQVGGVTMSTGTQLAVGRVARVGMGAAGLRAAREQVAVGKARVFGGLTPTGERAFGGGEIARQWGTELGLGLARAGVALIERTWIGGLVAICGASLSGWMERKISETTREREAQLHAQAEVAAQEFGGFLESRINSSNVQEEVDANGVSTGRRYIDVTLPDGTAVPPGVEAGADGKVHVRLFNASVEVGADGAVHWSATMEVPAGAGSVTKYAMRDGAVVLVEQVTGAGTAGETAIRYGVSQTAQGPVLQAIGVRVGKDEPFQEVRMDDAGRITQIGSISVVRNDQGTVIGFRDASGQTIATGQTLPEGNAMRGVVDAALGTQGQTMAAAGLAYGGNVEMLANAAKSGVNGSFTRTSQLYMEGLGLVQVTDRDMLGTGERTADGVLKGTFDITIVDPNYKPGDRGYTTTSAQAATPSGLIIHVVDGEYTTATMQMPDGTTQTHNLETRIDRGGVVTGTYIEGTSIQLNSELSLNRDASSVREQMGTFQSSMSSLAQAYAAWHESAGADAAAALRASNPELFRALDEACTARERSAEALERNLEARGITGGTAEAARLLLADAAPSAQDATNAAQLELGKKEFEDAFKKATSTGDQMFDATDIAGLGPRAKAYYESVSADARSMAREEATRYVVAALLNVDPNSPEGMRIMDDPRATQLMQDPQMRPFIDQNADQYTPYIVGRTLSSPQGTQAVDAAAYVAAVTPVIQQEATQIAAGLQSSDSAVHAEAQRQAEANQLTMQQVLEKKWQDAAPSVMAANAADLLHTEEGAQTIIAKSMLGIGTQLSGMSLPEVQAYVADQIARDPNLSNADRQSALAELPQAVPELLPQAKQVAMDFAAVPGVMSYEVSANPVQYLSSADQAYRSGYQPPAGLTGDAANAARSDFISAASSFFSNLPPDATQEQKDAAMLQFVSGYAQRAAANPQDNPLDLGPQAVFLGMAAAGPDTSSLSAMATPRADINQPSQPVSYDPLSISGFVSGTHAPLAAAEALGAAPAAAYGAATDAIQHYNAGEMHDAQVDFARSRAVVDAYDYALPSKKADRDKLLREGTQIQETEDFQARYAERREEFKTQFGVDIGAYGTSPTHRGGRGGGYQG